MRDLKISAVEKDELGHERVIDATEILAEATDAMILGIRQQAFQLLVIDWAPGYSWKNAPTVYVVMNAEEAEAWIRQNRPHLVDSDHARGTSAHPGSDRSSLGEDPETGPSDTLPF